MYIYKQLAIKYLLASVITLEKGLFHYENVKISIDFKNCHLMLVCFRFKQI